MMQRRRFRQIFIFSVLLLYLLPSFAQIKVGVFPRRGSEQTYKAFAPLVKHLSAQTGVQFVLIIPRSFPQFWQELSKQQFDLVHYNPYHYIKSHKEIGYQAILSNEEFGSNELSSQIVVRRDSGINSLLDLKGKTILFGGGKMAMASYIGPVALLKKAGLTKDIDYKVKFAKNPPTAITAVYNRHAIASGAGSIVLRFHQVRKKLDLDQLKVIANSDTFSHLVWAVKSDFDKTLQKKIIHIMTSLRSNYTGIKILNAARVTNFLPVTDDDFAKVREMTRYAIGESY